MQSSYEVYLYIQKSCKVTLFFAHVQIFLYFCSVKKKIIILLALCMAVGTVSAENKWDYNNRHNEIRIGWGDQLFESLIWHNPTAIITTMPVDYNQVYRENFHHDQHLWVEYQWRFKHWLSAGGMLDMSEVHWDEVTRNGHGEELSRDKGHYFYNLVIMPTVRFTYFHHPNVNLYSGLGLGVVVNGGTETDTQGRHTVAGAAVNVTVFGVSANYDRWFCTVDFGGMTAMQNANAIFMALSRMINVGVGVRF